MQHTETAKLPWYKKTNWPNALFLVGTPLAAFTLTPIHVSLHGLSSGLVIFFFSYAMITNLAVTAGYHRLFAHRSYDVSPVIKWLYLIVGAGAVQGSVLQWASDHRRHHREVDTYADPYSIKRGFFFAHIGWLFVKDDPIYKDKFSPDLLADKAILWQHEHYYPLAMFMSFGFPTLVGWAMGNPWGGLIIGGILRIVFTQHCTFFINSLCHMIGNQPYNDKNSAKDNFFMALFTCGEGYHNFHHRFASDYRNGVRWWQWDPTKWWIQSLAFLGLAYRLKRVSSWEILRARMAQQQKQLLSRGVPAETINARKTKIETAQARMRALKEDYGKLKASMQAQSRRRLLQLKAELKVAKLEFRMARAQWGAYFKTFKAVPAVSTAGY
ncbi:MAG: fatty acid desaturase [Bdellovibrionales bacterium]|nr:fatty acid desaturase [Bdellovibrionales bacterium]